MSKNSEQSTSLATVARMPLVTMQDAATLAQAFGQAHVLGASNQAEGMLAVAIINEMGIVRATAKYRIMMGQLSKTAHGILGDFVAAGGKYKIIRRDAECAEALVSFGETKDMTFRFSWEDAQQEPFVYEGKPADQWAELAKPIAQRKIKAKYRTPRSRMQMLWARIASDIGNCLCPDAGGGMYPPEVVEDFDAQGVPTNARSVQPISVDEARALQASQQQVAQPVQAMAPTTAPVQEPEPQDAEIVRDTGAFELCPVPGICFGHRWDEINNDGLKEMWNAAEVTDEHRTVIAEIVEERKRVFA